MDASSRCPGCGLELDCRALYGELLAREEDGVDPQHGPVLHKRFVGRVAFHWLEPPEPRGRLTVADALAATSPEEHREAIYAWAHDVWRAWAPHHETVRGWVRASMPT